MMLLRANSLSKGYSGVRGVVIDALCESSLRKHGGNIIKQQIQVSRIADIAIDLLALSATLARTTGIIERRGLEKARNEISMAYTFYSDARTRIRSNLRASTGHNNDESIQDVAAAAVAAGGYINAGQVCISVQRVITHPAVAADFLDALVPKVEAIRTGDPGSPDTTMGTLITTDEAERVEETIRRAVDEGAKLLTGGGRDGAIVAPAVVAGVDPRSSFSQEELFGPAVAVSSAEDFQGAIAQANGTPYGLGAGIFTSDVSGAVRAIREIDAGTVHINWTPLWRADLMPYGGLKASGIGKEGPRSAVAEMTDIKTVILHGRPW